MNEILRVQNGSKLYGLEHADSDDDYIGIFVEDPNTVFLGKAEKTRSLKETPDGERNGPGDVDGQSYSVRHFFHLLMKGNPSLLAVLYTPDQSIVDSTELGRMILKYQNLFVARNASNAFKGYMKAQLDRLTGVRTGHIPNRPELVEQFGYDVKYAQQVARLAFQGIEFLSTGNITLPMPEYERNLCMNIREGNFSYNACIDLLQILEKDLQQAADNSTLPESPDIEAIAFLSKTIHETYWRWLS